MAFEPDVIKQVVNVARRNGVDPSGLLAVVEVESDGKSLEADGLTPPIEINARIVRHTDVAQFRGMGVQFVDLPESERDRLRDYVIKNLTAYVTAVRARWRAVRPGNSERRIDEFAKAIGTAALQGLRR